MSIINHLYPAALLNRICLSSIICTQLLLLRGCLSLIICTQLLFLRGYVYHQSCGHKVLLFCITFSSKCTRCGCCKERFRTVFCYQRFTNGYVMLFCQYALVIIELVLKHQVNERALVVTHTCSVSQWGQHPLARSCGPSEWRLTRR